MEYCQKKSMYIYGFYNKLILFRLPNAGKKIFTKRHISEWARKSQAERVAERGQDKCL